MNIGLRHTRVPWQVILAAFTALFLLRNMLVGLYADDYAYAFVWDAEGGGNLMDDIGPRQRIEGLADIALSQWHHYFEWGGRLPALSLVQCFMWMGKGWFNVANTLAYLLLMLTIYWLAAGRVERPRHKACLVWVLVAMLMGVADYPSTMLWLTGSCVYLWTALWQCLFLLPYVVSLTAERAPLPETGDKHQLAKCLLMAGAGLLAGWSEEAGSLATLFVTAVLLASLRRSRPLAPWMKVGFALLLAGCLLLWISPGNRQRLLYCQTIDPDYVVPPDMMWSAQMFAVNFTEGFLPVVVMEAFLFIPIIYYLFKAKRTGDSSTERAPLLPVFTAAGLLVPLAMMLAPEFPARAGFHSTVLLTVASGMAIRCLTPRRVSKGRWWMGMAAVYVVATIAVSLYIECSVHKQNGQRMQYISQHQNNETIVVPALRIPHDLDRINGPHSITEFHLIYGGDLESKPSANRALMFARYHGLKAIASDRQTDWKKWGE